MLRSISATLLLFMPMVTVLVAATGTESDLHRDLYQGYVPYALPSENGEPVAVKISLVLRSIDTVDQVQGIIRTNIWLRQSWSDPRLSWDPANYSGITSTVMATNDLLDEYVWVPDLILYNTAEKPFIEMGDNGLQVFSDGSISWSRPGMLESTCSFDLARFPWDTQICELKFGSWAYPEHQLNLTANDPPVDTSSYSENLGWNLLSLTAIRNVFEYSCCPGELYPDITFHVKMERRSNFYLITIVVPAIAGAIIILASFFIPPEVGERISFSVTVMLSLAVYLLILSDALPPSNITPLLSIILLGLVMFATTVVFLNVVGVFLHSIEGPFRKSKTYVWKDVATLFDWICCGVFGFGLFIFLAIMMSKI